MVGMAEDGARKYITDTEFLANEIWNWRNSKKRKMQIAGKEYYRGNQDILKKKRYAIGKFGKRREVNNLPNSRIVDNQYAKMVDQKANYLCGKPITVTSTNEEYTDLLNRYFGKSFSKTLRQTAVDSLNGAIGWIMPYYDLEGNFKFRRFEPQSILPFWADEEHTVLDCAVHLYGVVTYEDRLTTKVVEHCEVFTTNGIYHFIFDNGMLIPESPRENYFSIGDQPYNWTRIPLVAFKYNFHELSLIRKIKSLQDGINYMESAYEDGMLENPRDSILVLVDYDGENLGEFRDNLSTYGAVKVRDNGDVRTLSIDVKSENYESILKTFKTALIENACGFDAKDDRMSTSPNEMNIQSMYSDIDLDANSMEAEFQEGMNNLLWFVNAHLSHIGYEFDEEVKFNFHRDILMNNASTIQQCVESVGLVSNRTILAHHPFVDDVDGELEELNREKQEDVKVYGLGTGVSEPNEPGG